MTKLCPNLFILFIVAGQRNQVFNPLLCLFSQPWIIEDAQKMIATKTTVVYTSVISSSQISLESRELTAAQFGAKPRKKRLQKYVESLRKKGQWFVRTPLLILHAVMRKIGSMLQQQWLAPLLNATKLQIAARIFTPPKNKQSIKIRKLSNNKPLSIFVKVCFNPL